MDILSWRGLLPAALAALACTATAQTPPSAGSKPPPPNPLDARASVPAVVYTSALARYRRTADDAAIPWREANDTVARIGGWRAYAREAQQPEFAPSAPLARPAAASTPHAGSAPAAQPAPGGHAGHRQP